MNTKIVCASLQHRSDIISLLLAQFKEHDIKLEQSAIEKAIDGVFQDPDQGIFIVAQREEKIVGFAFLAWIWTLEHGGKSAWLEELYVIPELRNQGIGKAILTEAYAQAKASGCVAIDLEVESHHQRAERLYQREGFRLYQRRRWVRML